MVPFKTASLYTSNKVNAAPLYVTMNHLKDGIAQAVIVNSGNANACAPKGEENAVRMTVAASKALGIPRENIVVASTGVIGVPLDIEAIEEGVPSLVEALSIEGSSDAAEAIMTTDTYKKEYALAFQLGDKIVRIGGISKGSGMIHPNMGTTLNFITTDVDISSELLEKAWRYCVKRSFNRISVDGDTRPMTACIMATDWRQIRRYLMIPPEYEMFIYFLLKLCVILARDSPGMGRAQAG